MYGIEIWTLDNMTKVDWVAEMKFFTTNGKAYTAQPQKKLYFRIQNWIFEIRT